MKKLFRYLISLLIIIFINYRASIVLNIPFIEMTFPIGLLCTILIWLFSSKGGPFTQMLNLTNPGAARAKSNAFKQDITTAFKEESEFNINISIPLVVSIFYTLIALVFNIVYFWDYFKNI
ncbi:MAG: hypothetical protein ACRCX2_02760 [Paraclostridium sp.]